MKKFFLLLFMTGGMQQFCMAQITDFQREFEEFTKQAQKEYSDFRSQANKEYADFMRLAWKEYISKPEIKKPKEKPFPPQPYPKDDKKEPIKDNPKPYDEVVPVVKPEPQPTPIEPIKETPLSEVTFHEFEFLQTECKVRLENSARFSLPSINANALASAWDRLATDKYNNVVHDCLQLREEHKLCDWAYLMMLRELSESFLGKDTNESILFCAYIYAQSGYMMRLGIGTNRVYMLVGSNHQIYNTSYWQIEGNNFYVFGPKENTLQICGASMPNEKPMSLMIEDIPLLTERQGSKRILQSDKYKDMLVEYYSDKNLVNFFDTYPSSVLGSNVCTKWSMYANTPISENVKRQLYPKLKNVISGKSQLDAANRLLDFVQTAFVYEYDDKVWGGDRAFFAEESLHYPYCDCEDRSILFSRLVRDLLGLKVLLVYYPGHLATAVEFTEKVTGDYISLNGRKFVVCDPTYIGAPVGATMPDMNNSMAKVIELD